ncbi:MAG: primase [Betaproteobacteria bacterium]|nr:primase [Betaproteobacteria bacterium]
MIPQSFIQDLLHRVDIVDVVDRYVKLKKAGANFMACCPFHSEKSPSFTVSPTKQFYHCFGCGAHGTAVGFMMEYSGLGYVDAIKDLAQSVGMKVPEAERSEYSQRKASESHDLYAVLLEAARFYGKCLKESPRAVAYLKSRGLSGEIAKRFGIGYAPEGWQGLTGAFADYANASLVTAGLVKQNDGKRYDVFRDRIMFPIVDVRGNVIGFGGRVLDTGEPKYLNSPETPVFEKGRELYGLYQARRAIREAERVLVVEGYMDVVALAQHGVEYAVATLGTATTGLHVQKLLRQADEVVFSFDGDAAGRRAAWRALENSLPELTDGKQVRFLFLPQGDDPDTYVRAHGKAGLEAILKSAVPLSRYLLDELSAHVDLASAEGRASLVHAARPLVSKLQKTAFRVQVLRELAERSRLALAEVETLCGLASVEPVRQQSARPPARPARSRTSPSLWRTLLRLMIDAPQLAEALTPDQHRLLETDPEFEPVVALVDTVKATGVSTTGALLEAARGSAHAELYAQVASDGLAGSSSFDNARTDLEGVLQKLELDAVKAQYQQLLAQPGMSDTERARLHRLQQRLSELKGGPPVGMVPPASPP